MGNSVKTQRAQDTKPTFESRLLRTQVVKMVLLLSLMRSERCSTKYLARGADTASRSSLALKRRYIIVKFILAMYEIYLLVDLRPQLGCDKRTLI